MSFNPGAASLSGSSDVFLSSPQDQQVLTYETSTSKWVNQAPTGATDATTSAKGIVQLTGDLGGTATAPTVPGLAGKANTTHSHAAGDVTSGTLAIARLPTGTTSSTVSLGNHSHVDATTAAAGFLSAADKTKLDGVAANANNYAHPSGDGNLHVPATSTTNNGRVLKAGATAGSLSWGTLTATDVGAAATTHTHAAGDITSGTISTARLGSGTANTTTYLRGDGAWTAPPSSGAMTPVQRTANYTAANGEWVICNASAGGFTVTLPTATAGAAVRVLKTDSSVNSVLVMGNGNATLAGSVSYSVNQQWMSQDFAADGTNWYCV